MEGLFQARGRGLLSTVLLAAGVGLLIASGVLFLFATNQRGYSGPGTVTGFGSVLSAVPPASPTPPATPVSTAPIERILIPAVKVDAPIVVKGIDANGEMEAPDNAYDVAWYDFTARPGTGSNAVFSGHVDYINVGPAVFWGLKDLKQGDRVEVRLADGTLFEYAVTAVNTFPTDNAPVDQIVGPTATESVTLITCTGTWDKVKKQYDQRLIVRAERV